ncbi:MAG: hypothetical protein H6686_07355 [Fibrobacteria bacterium]|nr:hypothetical protein [Fibrobacteria bacterium]
MQRICRQVLERLGEDEASWPVSGSACGDLLRHVAGCPKCRKILETTRRTIHLYRHVPAPSVPRGFHGRLRDALFLAWCCRGKKSGMAGSP